MGESEENKNRNRFLTCVLFPGIVKNDERAIQCMGGIKAISQTCAVSNKKRLGLNFQPENPYMKRIYADAHSAAGVLLKVKVRKVKEGDKVKKEVVSTSVLGRINKMFKFESLCDFQYLPVELDDNNKMRCCLDTLIPSGVDTVDFFMNPCSQFIVPTTFTRFDKPTHYLYTDKKYLTERKEPLPNVEEDMHTRTRMDRAKPLVQVNFNLIDQFPSKPHDFHIEHLKEKCKVMPQLEQEYEIIKKKFEERPIWSISLLRYHTKIKLMPLKLILPCLAFYFTSGPWQKNWCLLGYDPRKDPQARMYQTLDFRLRSTAGLHSLVQPRDQSFQYKKPDRVRHLKKKKPTEEPMAPDEVPEGAVIYRPGMVPAQRQIFYQYCDLRVPEVEALLAQDPPAGFLCHQKRGWLPPNADEICRDHIYKYVKESLIATHNANIKFDQGSSDEDSDSEDDETAGTSSMDVDETLNT